MSSPWLNIKVRRVSHELTTVQYQSPEGVLWAHHSSILNSRGCPISSPQFNIKVLRVSHELMGVQYSTTEDVQ